MLTKRLINQLLFEEDLLRQTGRTTKAVERALELDAYYVCWRLEQAYYLRKDYPNLKTVSMKQFLDMNYNRGSSEHFWFGSRRPKVVF